MTLADEEPQSQRAVGMRAALAHADFRRFLAAAGLSDVGDRIYVVGLTVYLVERTGSAAWVSGALVARVLPALLLGPLAGLLADRLPRRRLMIATDLARAALMALLLLLVVVDGPLLAILGVTVLASVVGLPYDSAVVAGVPRVVPERDLAAANSAFSVVDYVAMVGGPAVGGLLSATVGFPATIVANGLTFVASAALLLTVRTPLDAPSSEPPAYNGVAGRDEAEPDEAGPDEGVWQGLRAGVVAIGQDAVLRALVLVFLVVLFVYGFETVYLVFVADDLLGTGAAGLGWMNAAAGAGGVLGAFAVSRLATVTRVRLLLVAIIVGNTLPLALLAVIRQPWLAYTVLAVEGTASVAMDVAVTTSMQRNVAGDRLARAHGILGSLSQGAVLLGALLAPPLLALLGLPLALAVVGLVPAVVACVAIARRRDLELSPAAEAEARQATEAVGAVPALADLLPGPREVLASALGPAEAWPAGSVLMQQGEPSDEVVLLLQGTAEATAAAPPAAPSVSTVTGPDVLGEIGALQRRPRSATVTAVTDVVVRRVPAETFRAAVGLGDEMLPSVRALVGARLARF